MQRLYALLLGLLLHVAAMAQFNTISITGPQSVFDTSITALTIADTRDLLHEACGCKVAYNDSSAPVQIVLPEINATEANKLNRFADKANYPYRNYPEHNYSWKLYHRGAQAVAELSATSWQGVSFGLYGLLQEKLGFKFYHPKETYIPKWDNWPLQNDFTWSAKALFDKAGFHLHTEHPTELTEQLHDPLIERSLPDIKEYIDWLTRNGQTYFEFCLLESIDRERWPAHAKAMVDYVHQRGLMAAVDLSLHMIQQKTFQLYVGPVAKQKQVEKNLKWLMAADWDFINMEFSTAEFISGNEKKKEKLRLFIIQWLKEHTNTKLMGRRHVVKHDNEIGSKRKGFEWDSTSVALDKERGVLSHTVMFYDMTEPHAPVYENENQRHMYDFLLKENKVRETWYYPESAYWVTFDNSIPLLLLPYLNARLSDIDTCVKHNIAGHITFSSGWEWGYWLIDWSIARWSWQFAENGVNQQRYPAMYADACLSTAKEQQAFQGALNLQQQYLKDSTLMQWMTAMTITDEISIKAVANEYEPRPHWPYKFLRRKADLHLVDSLQQALLPQLQSFGAKSAAYAAMLDTVKGSAAREWRDGIAITGLRALHRYYTMQYTLGMRRNALLKTKTDYKPMLDSAEQVRQQGLKIVKFREHCYRYPVGLIADKRWDHTSYHFGYLWLAHNLHLWKREQEEARKNKYSPWFMNVWNVARIVGLIN